MKSGDLVIAKYLLEARLGVGGMGEVWAARHVGTGRDFAVKFMHPHIADSEASRIRFLREARVSTQIRHPAVVDVLDVGELEDGRLYMVMERLRGLELGEAFTATPPLSARDLVIVLRDITSGLAMAHAAGIVHRDIKPANVFLHVDPATGLVAPKLLDFGVSKFASTLDSLQTQASSVVGSPRYMSPEQTKSAAATDHRSDLWAIGVVLFEGLAGVFPHEGDGLSGLVVAIATTPPRSLDLLAPHLPQALRDVVRDCLLPVEQRIPSARELEARLEAVLAEPSLGAIALPPRAARERSRSASSSGLRFRTGHASAVRPATFTLPGAGHGMTPRPVEEATLALPHYGTPAPDRITGSLSTMNVETVAPRGTPAPAPFVPRPQTALPPSSGASALRLVAALLALLTVAIGLAIFTMLRRDHSPAQSASAPPQSSMEAAPVASAPPATPPLPAPPSPEPSASASAAPAASASASSTATASPAAARPAAAAPAAKPKSAATGGAKSKVEELGSGL
jgi:serine/threonine protein kinase